MIGPSAQPVSFRRRQLLQAGFIAGLSSLAGCARSNGSPLLRAPTKSLPALWQKQLKAPWRITELRSHQQLRRPPRGCRPPTYSRLGMVGYRVLTQDRFKPLMPLLFKHNLDLHQSGFCLNCLRPGKAKFFLWASAPGSCCFEENQPSKTKLPTAGRFFWIQNSRGTSFCRRARGW